MDEQIAIVRNRLAALTGARPDRGRSIARPSRLLAREFGLPANLALDLVSQRPDLAAARLRVEVAAHRIKVARADLYLNVSLVAFPGVPSLGLLNLTGDDPTVGRVAPAIHLPIFAGGRLAGRNLAPAAATKKPSPSMMRRWSAQCARSPMPPLRCARSARASTRTLARAAAERAYGIARQRFDGGLSTCLSVLSAEDELLDTRRTDAAIKARAFTLDVALIGALGGGCIETQAEK